MPEGRINVQTTGLFGVPEKSHKTDCPQSNNPHGHNPKCPCRSRRHQQQKALDALLLGERDTDA